MTLMELMLAITVVGILGAIALPRLNSDRFTVDSGARALTLELAYAARSATTLQHNVRVAFDVPTGRVRLHEDANNDGVVGGGERVVWTALGEGMIFGQGAAPAAVIGAGPVTFTRTQDGFPVVTFRRDGSASEYGGFYLTTVRARNRGDAGAVRTVEVIPGTGRIMWYSHATGAWRRGS
jgi:Tfp pilus assembly protein FimT